MARILLAYSSVDGYTRRICESLKAGLEYRGHHVEVSALVEAAGLDRHDVIIIGASIRHGRHRPAVREFIRTHREILDARPSGFFSVNLVARKPGKSTPASNPYVRKFLHQTRWQPGLVGVFAGNLDYSRYGAIDRHIIRLIMWLTGGPTDLRAKVEYTDWDEVRRFAEQIADVAGAASGKETQA